VDRLRLDLLGPTSPDEVLIEKKAIREGDTPLSRYLLGILYPADTPLEPEEDDFANNAAEGEEAESPEAPTPIAGIPKPSSIGLSFALASDTTDIMVEFRYGLYVPTELPPEGEAGESGEKGNPTRKPRPTILWKRSQQAHRVSLNVLHPAGRRTAMPGGAVGEWVCRHEGELHTVSVFLRNGNTAVAGPDDPEQCLYQPEIIVSGGRPEGTPIVNRAHQASHTTFDPDLDTYRLLYRNRPEYAVGHGSAVEWDDDGCPNGRARLVRTELLPAYELPLTEARGGIGITGLDMKVLTEAPSGKAAQEVLSPLADQYRAWIKEQWESVRDLPEEMHQRAKDHLTDCEEALHRMHEGLELVARDPFVFEAFQFANQAMLLQRRKSVEATNFRKGKGRTYDADPPTWRPFQMAFILLNLKSIASPESADRQIVDLLWFPTGGGKTEAYLGLAAFTMALRRLRHTTAPRPEGCGDGGVVVLMRYTLRLLTIQQFQRAATLLCACETLRREAGTRYGQEPFSIGLWVGGGATPNWIDQKPDPQFGREPGAYQALEHFDPANEPPTGNPVQLRFCPWCGEPLAHTDYSAIRELLHLQIRCPNAECAFHGHADDLFSGIPAFVVDEDIYLRCPTMLIGTVDKFARLPWDERTKALFGRVDRRCERHGYLAEGVSYQRCGGAHNQKGALQATGQPAVVPSFLPPELIIQDELHLITGPLGSLVGLYESAVDFLCSRTSRRPKVVASTATIRRYRDQIRGLFDREARQFPPPGLAAGDSFFAAETSEKSGRLYIGVCGPGKSLKTAAVRIQASLLESSELMRRSVALDAVDPYWTVVNYFNSLRELGGALRLIDDDIRQRLVYLANQDSIAPARVPERHPELTSRIPAKDISSLLAEMEQTLASGKALDVVLCTNMISVGVDIQRFGLMTVTGQPKTSAEYIQASSRVGRQPPGLIVTLYNWSRPRDLSHYEHFRTFHSMMYRHVEAGSVTPFSSRARDKGFHGVFVGLLRLLDARLTGNSGAQRFNPADPLVRQVFSHLLDRVRRNDPEELDDARASLQAFMDGWVELQARCGTDLKFVPPGAVDKTKPRTWLIEPAEDADGVAFPRPTLNSLREVEGTSVLYFKNFRRIGVKGA